MLNLAGIQGLYKGIEELDAMAASLSGLHPENHPRALEWYDANSS
jgi:hypothetical protein